MKTAVTKTASTHAYSADVQPIISAELPASEETPVTFSNVFALVGILLLTQLILVIIIVLVCRLAGKIQQYRHRIGRL